MSDVSPSVLQVKVLFVRNLANSVTEEILEKAFSAFGKLERVKKLKDYAFVHFEEREGAVKVHASTPHLLVLEYFCFFIRKGPKTVELFIQALDEMNGKELEGEPIEIVFAKPPDQKRKERKAQRQAAKTQMYDTEGYTCTSK